MSFLYSKVDDLVTFDANELTKQGRLCIFVRTMAREVKNITNVSSKLKALIFQYQEEKKAKQVELKAFAQEYLSAQ